MRKFLLSFLTLACFHSYSQTLFTYGNDSVSVKDFLQAYNKNNTSAKTPQAVQQYLDLYIASRLKIKEALARRYDTLPQLMADIDNLRSQILPAFEKDNEALDKLTSEALTRTQKDIHIAHIFIGFADVVGRIDSIKAKQRATEAYTLLKSGKAFKDVVVQYSDDTTSKSTGGDLGYITAFTLPYELENLAYATAPNQLSKLYQSKAGYHIFKNLGERKALGRIKAAQILIAFPPGTSATQKKDLKKRTDSLYNRLLKGDDFGKLAASFSNDYVSAQANGQIPEFGVGQYIPLFENIILGLKDGTFSKPFETEYGYHIVKRIKVTPFPPKADDKTKQSIRERVEQDERANIAKDILVKKVIERSHYQRLGVEDKNLWAYTDSVFSNLTPATPTKITLATPLFKIGDDINTTADWISFAQVSRYKSDGSGFKPYSQVWNEFVNNAALEYYKNHLENFNPAFRNQMNEFKDGNLFFEIMQREIWGPAQSDTVAVEAYYQKNRGKYNWSKSAGAVIFYTADLQLSQLLSAQLKKDPSSWKTLVANMSDGVSADSGRFEMTQIPGLNSKTPVTKGTITTPVVNKSDNTASFAYITHIYTKPEPRTYEEAKGLVVNDYQVELEQKWLAELRKKYPVTVNQAVLASLLNNTAKK
jgi:peptidyl-prolyl cis-trans isomerase SurA